MARSRAKAISRGTGPVSDPLDTPMMRQYVELKAQYPEAILFFRMGDFYEVFLEDAETAAPLMDVALTARQNRIPMAGVPYHSVDTYVARLIGAGRKVAIAEQEPDPVNPKLMRRAVTRIVSPGTLVEEHLLESSSHNYLLAIVPHGDRLGMALADISTGDFFTMEARATASLDGAPDGREPRSENETDLFPWSGSLRDVWFRYAPREVLTPSEMLGGLRALLPEAAASITALEDWKASPIEGERRIEQAFGANLRGLGYEDQAGPALGAASLVMHYVTRAFPGQTVQLNPPVFRQTQDSLMLLDEQTIRNLDLVFNYQEGGASRTLFGVLNHCRTACGKRFLKEALTAPLLDRKEIEARLDRVEFLLRQPTVAEGIRGALQGVHDLERVVSRVAAGRAAPRDTTALRATIEAAVTLQSISATGERAGALAGAVAVPKELRAFAEWVAATFEPEPPAVLGKAAFVREGVSKELDAARSASGNALQWMLDFEKAERERTGIATLKVKYNKIVGYFIEISKAQAAAAPEDYRRKQTLVNAERFSSERLSELEQQIAEADGIIERIERETFAEFQERLLGERTAIKALMLALSQLDFTLALGHAAGRHDWCRPQIADSGEYTVEDGRHPVVEAYLEGPHRFVPNNIRMDAAERSFALITGPNMAGKSTYIRQAAILQLLMQIGSYVPARHAVLSIVDRIFTRIGASDNLTRGESTFYVEMLESARILNQSTDRSLVIMDEVGRGTSTYDGLSIAWAMVEFFSGDNAPRPRVLFATHYHELTALESRAGVFTLTMDVQEAGGKVIFMHRVREGTADRSYGIHVARLAGLPPEITARAEEKLRELEQDYLREREKPPSPTLRKRPNRSRPPAGGEQQSLF